jgi:5-methylcytosine-specific restriction endonuclease McrA
MTKDEKREYDRKRYEEIKADPERLAAKRASARNATKAYYKRNQGAQIAKTAEWRKKNPKKRKAQKERHYLKHRRRYCQKEKDRRDHNPGHNRAACAARYAANKEAHKERVSLWRRANRDRRTQYANRRRALKSVGGKTHSIDEWKALIKRRDGRCFYCGRRDLPLTRDHMIPLTRGGSDAIENIVPACRPCNSAKGTKTTDEFLAKIF